MIGGDGGIGAHSGQSSQLPVDANDGNAQFLPKLAGAVAWHTRHKSFKRVLMRPAAGDAGRWLLMTMPLLKRSRVRCPLQLEFTNDDRIDCVSNSIDEINRRLTIGKSMAYFTPIPIVGSMSPS